MTRHLLPVYLTTVLFLCSTALFALSAEVPHTLEFAGMKLKIHESARRKIAEDVDALRKSEKYFKLKLDRVNMYLPIIEKVFEEEGLPEDFKYLAIQESSLISDAVSSSNAVGYWQFKKESALEVGLVVNGEVDERKHIISATRGAARYLKRNNYYLRNWVYSLLSYNMGLGGTQRSVDQRHFGAEQMDITGKTHWYVLKFLAHMIAFRDAAGPIARPDVTLLSYAECKGKTLAAIARELDVPEEDVKLYNKWLSRNRIPEDRDYVVMIPAPAERVEFLMAKLNVPADGLPQETAEEEYVAVKETPVERDTRFPVLKKRGESRGSGTKRTVFYTVNGKPGVQAQPGDNSARLAQQANINLDRFLEYNDLKRNEPLIPGEVYYLRKKRAKAKVHEHVTIEGETLWQISQKYGITMKALMRKNRMQRPEKLQHGRVLWLRFMRPYNTPVEVRNVPRPTYAVKGESVKPKLESQPETAPAAKPETKPVPAKAEPPAKAAPSPAVSVPADAQPDTVVPPVAGASTESVKTDSVAEPPLEPEPAANPVQPNVPGNFKIHEVSTGQTLFAIARQYNVSVADLRKWNNLREGEGIQIGQKLMVSVADQPLQPATAPAESKEYTVQTGDTLYKIAREHKVTVQQLLEWNGKTDAGVSVGEKLTIKVPHE